MTPLLVQPDSGGRLSGGFLYNARMAEQGLWVLRNLPGFVRVVSKGNYVAVVCEREEQAINASRKLKANWEKPTTAPFPSSEDLFQFMRAATPTSVSNPVVVGNPDSAFAGAAFFEAAFLAACCAIRSCRRASWNANAARRAAP